MMKKIISLTKIFCKDYYQNLDILNDRNKINKKSIYVWLIVIVMIALGFISYEVIKYLKIIDQVEIFLNVYLLVLAIIQIFQTILICTNVFYFSKDLEYVLPLPLKPVELLISKFNNIVFILYVSEIIFGVIPFSIYGLMASDSIFYFPQLIIILLIFPIFISLIISTIMLFIMKLAKYVKNKDVFQLIIALVLIFTVFTALIIAIEDIFIIGENINNSSVEHITKEVEFFNSKMQKVNKYFLIINPSANILSSNNGVSKTIELLKITIIESICFIIFIFAGKVLYLNNILKNFNYINTKKMKFRDINLKGKYKRRSIKNTYILKEAKTIIKNPIFFLQYIYPVTTLLILVIIIIITFWPAILETLTIDEIANQVKDLKFNVEFMSLILIIIQIINSFINISISAISREGSNAIFIKYIPVSLYKQFLYKNTLQIIISSIVSISILFTLYFVTKSIGIIYLVGMFIISFIINVINSYLMLIVDLRRPKLDWDNEIVVLKQNDNKLFQYAFSIFIFLFLLYLSEFLSQINLLIAMVVIVLIFFAILLLIDIVVRKKQNKLFNNII